MLIFLDRSEEAAVCFANTLHGRHPPPEAQVALLHLRTSCPDSSVHEVTESMHLDGTDKFTRHIEPLPCELSHEREWCS